MPRFGILKIILSQHNIVYNQFWVYCELHINIIFFTIYTVTYFWLNDKSLD